MERKKILIIDDDADIRIGLNARLKASGFDTSFAEDGVSALTVARREKPDLIILDLGLPGGDGFVVLKRLKSNTELAMVPVVIFSAREPGENEKRALEAGAHAFFQKPADNDELIGTILNAVA